MEDFSKIRCATVYFCDGLSVDGFQLPDGSFYVSITSASIALGYARNWLSRAVGRGGNTFKALSGAGFSGETSEVVTPSLGGEQKAKLIPLQDFNRLILYASFQGKKETIALADALMNMSMVDFFRASFGERPLTIGEKRDQFYTAYAKTINWLQEDRLDFQIIEEHLRFLGEK